MGVVEEPWGGPSSAQIALVEADGHLSLVGGEEVGVDLSRHQSHHRARW
jgi:hypothetical protein